MKKSRQHRRKLTVHHYKPQPAYPNAADPSYFRDKLLDQITLIVSGMGFACAMAFLTTLA